MRTDISLAAHGWPRGGRKLLRDSFRDGFGGVPGLVAAPRCAVGPAGVPPALQVPTPMDGVKLYVHYANAWWRNLFNLTSGSFGPDIQCYLNFAGFLKYVECFHIMFCR